MLRELEKIQGLMEKTRALGLGAHEPDAVRASAAEFILEGLYAHRRITRTEEVGFESTHGAEAPGIVPNPDIAGDEQEESSARRRNRRKFN